jgi:hypothetical protein
MGSRFPHRARERHEREEVKRMNKQELIGKIATDTASHAPPPAIESSQEASRRR